MLNFRFQPLPWNIVFGKGSLNRISDELEKLNFSNALILTTEGQKEKGERLLSLLGSKAVGLFSDAKMHVPMATVEHALLEAQKTGADCTISIGGGSTTGLGKALALKASIQNIAIPTTYAGSEMTNIWGITENDRKVTGRDNIVVPRVIIYDPELTMSLPASIVGPSGLNAMAQAVVNVATDKQNPMVSMMALEAISAISEYLPKIINNPDDIDAREQVLYGSSMAGAALGIGTTGLHHKLCHTFGGTFNTPHAETHAILLPYSVAYNASATKSGTRKIADAMNVTDAAVGLQDLAKAVGAPTSLKEIGIKESDIERAVAVAMEMKFPNPEPVTADRLKQMLLMAYHGDRPTALL